MHPATAGTNAPPRGVYELPYRKDGCPVLVALDSRGDERKRVKLLPGISYDRAWSYLEALLDRVDPESEQPKLELVQERGAGKTAKPARRALTPSHADDYRAYRNRLIKQLSHRLSLYRD